MATLLTHLIPPLRQAQHRLHELIIINLDVPSALGIESRKRLAELLDDDARADETVERDSRLWSTHGGSLVGFYVYPERVAQVRRLQLMKKDGEDSHRISSAIGQAVEGRGCT